LEQERLEQERLEQERQERLEQEKILKDLERTRKRRTQIDIKSLVFSRAIRNQDGLFPTGHA